MNFAYVPEVLDVELGDNEYLGIGYGIGGLLAVKATVEDGVLTAVDVVRSNETPDIGEAILPALPSLAISANGVDFDVITGATATTNAFKAALADALTAAGVEVQVQEVGDDQGAVSYLEMDE